MFDLTGKRALVTGATQGIGFAVAQLLAEHGAQVFVNGATSDDKCRAASEKIPNSVPVRADLTKMSEIDELYRKTGDVDILILNASIQYKRDWDSFTEEEFDSQLNCNLKSSYFLIKKYASHMMESKWGRIVTVGSVNQYNNHPQLALYGMTKAAQKKLVENIAPHLAPYNVTINNVAPGAIITPRNTEALSDAEFNKRVVASIPAGYVGSPEEVTPAILLLCSDEGRYITGSEIIIDGGMHL
ncbi:MAG: SDR family NAD(P)-dependent oxidoreductase [Clostridiales bacterium]|nr:SDR family NAD(P)-dependent oxidoreductase [Clostridiales bacterium]